MILVASLVLALVFLPLPWNAAVVAAGAVGEVVVVALEVRHSRRGRPAVGVESLVGATAEAVTPLAPAGRVKLNGELWNAHAGAAVEAGARVRVTAVRGLTLEVEAQGS